MRVVNWRSPATPSMCHSFKPDCYWWRLLLLGRKFALATVALMFNGNPMFQASVSIAVMFVSCECCSIAAGLYHAC